MTELRQSGGRLLALLHLCDSLFPVGAFAHSDGLETATARGDITDGPGLRAWLDAVLDESIAPLDGPVVARSWRAFAADDLRLLSAIDDEAFALRASSAGREATRAMGTRLVRTWLEIHPEPRLTLVRERLQAFTLPAAFGVVSASAGIAQEEAVCGYAYTRLAATISAAMRLMPLGQHDAHAQLAAVLARVPAVAADVVAGGPPLASFAPAVDIAQMRHQYEHSRLFRS